MVGDSATLRAAAIGTTAPSYQWQKDGTAVPGATSSVLNFPVTTLADAGRYTIVVTNVGGVASASATLTVRTPPVITTGPASQSVFAGDRTTLTVSTTGVPAPTLQWRKNGTAISGATNPTLSFASTATTDAGRYEVVASNVLGTSGLGAILIQALDGQNNPTTAGALDANARIWTETTCGSLTGTVSQSVPAVLLEGWRNASPAYVHGVRHNPQFRTNYGIVNLDSQDRTFRVLVRSLGGLVEEFVTVPRFGTVHRPVPPGVADGLSIYVEPLAPSGPWRAYAATTDNQSGSGWTVVATQPRTDVQF